MALLSSQPRLLSSPLPLFSSLILLVIFLLLFLLLFLFLTISFIAAGVASVNSGTRRGTLSVSIRWSRITLTPRGSFAGPMNYDVIISHTDVFPHSFIGNLAPPTTLQFLGLAMTLLFVMMTSSLRVPVAVLRWGRPRGERCSSSSLWASRALPRALCLPLPIRPKTAWSEFLEKMRYDVIITNRDDVILTWMHSSAFFSRHTCSKQCLNERGGFRLRRLPRRDHPNEDLVVLKSLDRVL